MLAIVDDKGRYFSDCDGVEWNDCVAVANLYHSYDAVAEEIAFYGLEEFGAKVVEVFE